mmetsp:Transcript_52331/g.87417  ORF Transcript_52331/g.87417 Transcript_52331/m.87417 type:complete len:231 (+) Transcript_52331:1078-1770(+)
MADQQLGLCGRHFLDALYVLPGGRGHLDSGPPVRTKVVLHVLRQRGQAAQLRVVQRLDGGVLALVEGLLHGLVHEVQPGHQVGEGLFVGDALEEPAHKRRVLRHRVRLPRAFVQHEGEPLQTGIGHRCCGLRALGVRSGVPTGKLRPCTCPGAHYGPQQLGRPGRGCCGGAQPKGGRCTPGVRRNVHPHHECHREEHNTGKHNPGPQVSSPGSGLLGEECVVFINMDGHG